jgi:alkanesulfonate monooxygenase SsuD/methylene tetrahydromethanopterin reductase-like flavin-dependent oxidoreductase (luciferase family)
MQFGWLTLALSPTPDEDAARIEQQIEQVCAAEYLGFSDVWLTEHYFTGESVYNDALLFAAALTMRTTRVRMIRGRADAVPSPDPPRHPTGSAGQPQQRPDRCRCRQGDHLQRV